MSLPLNPPPDSEGLLQPAPSELEPIPETTGEAVPLPPAPRFPAWKGWDILAVLLFTVVCIFLFSLIALFVAKASPAYRNMSFTDAASKLSTNAQILVSAQGAAYLFVLLFIFMLVRTRSREPFAQAIRWNWPGSWAPAFLLGGVVLALVVDGLSRFLPIPKSLPMDNFFNDATSAYMMAAFGLTLAPLLEELFFRGLLYPLLRRAMGLVASVLLTALAFAAIHGAQLGYAWAPVLSIFVVGVVFTVVRERLNSVAASFLMHCGYNFTLFTMLWLASDHFHHLEKATG
ncbi:MAG: type II CAAX endopeptidase family protein [Candidatus Korobacteraceae bacterium]